MKSCARKRHLNQCFTHSALLSLPAFSIVKNLGRINETELEKLITKISHPQ